ncbi:MAG: hypothetical protein EA408_00400 [Marinilabiliales bacterium]|nr:MAG: hypothetical protein EA408_00400 [Marinilabiliales bacterium]
MMDNIENIWNELSCDFDKKRLPDGADGKINSNRSDLLLARLGLKLKLGLYWTIFFMVALGVVAIVHISQPPVLALIGLMFLMMAGNLIYSGRLYLKIKRENEFSLNTRAVLLNYYRGVVRILKMERLWTQFAIPLGLIAGVLYVQLLDTGSFGQIEFEPRTLLITGILMVTLVPLVILWTHWTQKYAYKNDLTELRTVINELNEDEENPVNNPE